MFVLFVLLSIVAHCLRIVSGKFSDVFHCSNIERMEYNWPPSLSLLAPCPIPLTYLPPFLHTSEWQETRGHLALGARYQPRYSAISFCLLLVFSSPWLRGSMVLLASHLLAHGVWNACASLNRAPARLRHNPAAATRFNQWLS